MSKLQSHSIVSRQGRESQQNKLEMKDTFLISLLQTKKGFVAKIGINLKPPLAPVTTILQVDFTNFLGLKRDFTVSVLVI